MEPLSRGNPLPSVSLLVCLVQVYHIRLTFILQSSLATINFCATWPVYVKARTGSNALAWLASRGAGGHPPRPPPPGVARFAWALISPFFPLAGLSKLVIAVSSYITTVLLDPRRGQIYSRSRASFLGASPQTPRGSLRSGHGMPRCPSVNWGLGIRPRRSVNWFGIRRRSSEASHGGSGGLAPQERTIYSRWGLT
jgi:hypothetical protein